MEFRGHAIKKRTRFRVVGLRLLVRYIKKIEQEGSEGIGFRAPISMPSGKRREECRVKKGMLTPEDC